MSIRKWLVTSVAVLCGVNAGGHLRAEVIEAINADETPASHTYMLAHEVGWFYSPSEAYVLDGIETKFGTVPQGGRTVTVELYDAHPLDEGSLLRSSTFAASTSLAGVSFEPIALLFGETYFVGFRNVSGLGVNYTDASDATELDFNRWGNADAGAYENTGWKTYHKKPILRFNGSPIPAPSTLVGLVTMGIMGLAIALRRRFKKAA